MRGKKAKMLRKGTYRLYVPDVEDRVARDPSTGEIFHIGPRALYQRAKRAYKNRHRSK